MKFRTRLDRVLQGITLGTLAAMLMTSNLRAQAPAKAPEPAAPSIADLGSKQEANANKFQDFKEGLFRLAKRLEKSDRAEDKETAKIILAAIDQAQKSGVDSQFQKLVLGLKAGNLAVNDLQKIEGDGQQLSKMLKEIYDILMTDDEAAKLKAEIARLEAILKNAKEIKNTQERLQDNTQSKTGKAEDLSKQQDKLKDRTEDLAKQMGGKDPKEGKPAAKKDDRAEPKSEPKPGESSAEPKPESSQEKGEPKDSDPMSKEGDPKEGAGEPKEGKPGDPKAGESKDGKGDPKEGGEPKPGDPKEGGEPKPGEPKPGEPKDPMGGKPGEPKPGEPKPGEPKPGEPKPGEGKPGEGKPGEAKEGKPSEGKGQGQGKGEAKPSEPGKGGEGKGQNAPPMGGGKPSESKPGGGEPKPGEPGQGQPGGGQPPPKETPGRKEVQDAIPFQDEASKQLPKDRNQAGKNQDKATNELAKAIEELEKRLKQLREEEMKKLLANVEARVGKMLQMQIDVYNATVAIDGSITKNGGAKTVADTQKAQQQGDKEQEIVFEADRALKLLESEGSAVAFARVLEEVRQDMIAVQRRLSQSVVNGETQEIEKNIIDMLTEMKEALKQAQKDQEPQPPKEGKPGESKPQDKKLIDLIAELKLIRSMQVQVNKRTEMHGKKADQVADPLIQGEIRQLSTRQAKLQDMLEKIAAGANQ